MQNTTEEYKNSEITFSLNKIESDLLSYEVMMDWESDIMEKHSEIVCHNNGDVLEIGFGMGISADYIQGLTPSSHTIIEIHPDIYEKLEEWAIGKTGVTIINDDWYNVKDSLGQYDGIFYDALHDPNVPEFMKEFSPNHLKSGGKLTYFNPDPNGLDQYNISPTFVTMSVSPPTNGYFTHSVYHVPTVQF